MPDRDIMRRHLSIVTTQVVQNCAYLCNMAVDAMYRRKGYGNILLDAADDVARIAGEKDVYLHLRYVLLLRMLLPLLLHCCCVPMTDMLKDCAMHDVMHSAPVLPITFGNALCDAMMSVVTRSGVSMLQQPESCSFLQEVIVVSSRFQDQAPASLYKQAGYVSDKADSVLVRILGLDRRYLMKKRQSSD